MRIEGRMMHGVERGRRGLAVVLATATLLGIGTPARAVSDRDPNDVRGGFDLRWIAATTTDAGRIRLTVSFYPGFRRADLPRGREWFMPGVWFKVDEAFTGWFFRGKGRLWFRFGDTGSSCCTTYGATNIDPLTLRATFRPLDEGKPGIPIRGHSRWKWPKGPHDWTGTLHLPASAP
jgi:hypothetical protein